MQFHELANIFPMMTDPEIAALGQDIKVRGQNYPVIIYEDLILDGRSRWQACGLEGLDCWMEDLAPGVDPVGFLVSVHLRRRDMTPAQRAMAAAKLTALTNRQVTIPTSEDTPAPSPAPGPAPSPVEPIPIRQAAAALNVSPRLVTDARTILETNDEEIIQSVNEGETTLKDAAGDIRRREAEQPGSTKRESKSKPKEKNGSPVDKFTASEWNKHIGKLTSCLDKIMRQYGLVRPNHNVLETPEYLRIRKLLDEFDQEVDRWRQRLSAEWKQRQSRTNKENP